MTAITSAAPQRVRFERRPAGPAALGMDETAPRLSWIVPAASEGFMQQAYEVEVTRTTWGGQPTTSTTIVESAEQVLVPWPGVPLLAREQAAVRVRVRGDDWSEWSQWAVVEGGLLTPSDWQARFISPRGIGRIGDPAPAVTGHVELSAQVRQARLTISAHGWYEAQINGVRVGDDYFGPGWTSYAHRLRSCVYDVTSLLRLGSNELTIVLGNGWFRGRLGWEGRRAHYGDRLAALAQLDVLTEDGRQLTLATDGTWQARHTNILADDIYDGQTTDLRRPLLADELSPVDVLDEDLGRLVGAQGPAVQVTDVLPAQRVWRSPAGKLLIDFGQNAVGFVRLRVRGLSPGAEVVVRHAEVLEHGELGTRPLRTAKCTDTYDVHGDAEEVLEPRFTFHGFRYAQVDGADDVHTADAQAVVLGSHLPRTGTFACSEPLLNQLHANVVWSMRGNFLAVPTDCPQRDERLGWTGDIQVFSPTALFLHDAAGFLADWTADLAADQRPDGTVGIVVPDILQAPFAAAAWGDAAVIVPWNIYRATGDEQLLRRQLSSMRSWVDKVDALAGEQHLWVGGFQFGDWLDPDAPADQPDKAKADPDVVATACFYHCTDVLAQAYRVVGDDEQAGRYRRRAEAIQQAFVDHYVTHDGRIASDAPTVYAQAIVWGMLSADQQLRAGERLAELAEEASFKVSTGFVGTPLITDALSLTAHTDVAYRLLEERGCPSWLYPVTMGATTIWERWDSMLPDGSINPGEMTSFNHYALGAVADWMHRVVAGLAPAEPGYRRLLIAPQPGGTLSAAKATLETPYGTAGVAWTRDGDRLTLNVTVPVGATAEVHVPGGEVIEVPAGTHRFTR